MRSGTTQDDSELFRRLSKDTTVKITLGLIQRRSPSENNKQNLTLEDQHGTERQNYVNCFKNNKPPDSS